MRNRTVQAITMGLSALTLTGPASLNVLAMEDVAVSTSEEATSEEQEVASNAEEVAVAEEISNLSEQFNNASGSNELKESVSETVLEGQYDQQISDISEDESAVKESVDSTSVSVENTAKASEAIDIAASEAGNAADILNEVAASVNETANQAADAANNTVAVITDESTVKSDAEVLIADTEKSVEEAKDAFDTATENYNQILEEYNAAKDDYDTAVDAYNTNKESAKTSLEQANEALGAAQSKLEDLEKQLAEARQDLANAGADALICAEDSKGDDADSYVSAVLEHYYIPQTEELSEGQIIDGFTVTEGSEGKGHLKVSYHIVDENGKSLRDVNADYGYTVDPNTGEIQLFTKERTYYFADSKGKTISLDKEASDQIKGLGDIDYDNLYVPAFMARKRAVSVNSYSRVFNTLSNTGTALWNDGDTKYVSYVSGLRLKVAAYDNLIQTVAKARIDYKNAQEKVVEIQEKLEKLNKSGSLISMVEVVNLGQKLENAQENYCQARENLEKAKNSLSEAKDIFNTRFSEVPTPEANSDGAPEEIIQPETSEVDSQQVQYSNRSEGTSGAYSSSVSVPSSSAIAQLETEIEADLNDDVLNENVLNRNETTSNRKVTAQHSSVAEEATIATDDSRESNEAKKKTPVKNPVLDKKIITIQEEEVPQGITLTGLLERSKWFMGLAGASVAGIGVAILEIRRRAQAKIKDKLNE